MILRLIRRWRLRPAHAARLAGDRARDAGLWGEAAGHYRRAVALVPAEHRIWVQLGHAEKERGDLAAAEAAYREAGRLAPADPDPPLHLGHALKLQGRLDEAADAYAISTRLAPTDHAAIELAALRPESAPLAARPLARGPAGPAPERLARVQAARDEAAAAPADPARQLALAEAARAAGLLPEARAAAQAAFALAPTRRHWQALRRASGEAPMSAPAPEATTGRMLYDVTDLLNLVAETGRATGIQRVQLGLAEAILADPAAAAEARFVAMAERMGPLWALDPGDLAALLTYCLAEPHDLARARALVERAPYRARPADLAAARAFVILGAFWFWAGAPDALARLRAAGLRIGVLVYDLIPVTHPEYTSEGTVRAFRKGLAEGARLWDFALTISAWTARVLERELAALGAPPIPVRPVPLAHRMNAGADPGGNAWPAELADLRGRGYVLCVGTLEARKNHLALFQAWRLLRDEGFAPPPLVLVGRPGWRVEDLMAQLEATRFLDGRIRVVHGVSDPELAALYRECLFTVFPSFTEGWGLPVGESLAFGRPVLAALEGATPEAAAGFARPIDALNPRGIAAEVRRLCEDPALLAAEAERVRQGFRPRLWPEVGAEFLAAVAELAGRPPPQREAAGAARLAPGLGLPLAEGLPGAQLLGAGFEPPEPGGAPLLGHHGALQFELDRPATVLLRFMARPWAEMNRLGVVHGAGEPRWHGLMPGREVVVALPLPAGPHALGVLVEGPLDAPPGEDPRPARVALVEVAAAPQAEPVLAARRLLRFGAGEADPAWAAALAEGWDLSADSTGVRPIASAVRLAFRAEGADAGAALRVALHLAVRPGATGRFLHPGGEAQLPAAGGLFVLPVPLVAGEAGRVELRLAMAEGGAPPLRLVALQWCAEEDVAGRLALLEAALLPAGEPGAGGEAPGRLAELEARLAAASGGALPGGEAGRAARRLGPPRRG